MTVTKKQIETAARYKKMGWSETESSSKCIVLEKGMHKVKVLKCGKAVREVGK
jgi:hypothetical protein